MTLGSKIKWFIILLIAANLVIVLMVMLGAFEKKPVLQPMPNPNGYDDFVKAENLLRDRGTVTNASTATEQELAALVATNAEALRMARMGLSRECRMPHNYSTNYEVYLDQLNSQLSLFRQVAFNFRAAGSLAIDRGQTNDAIEDFLDAIRFGDQFCRGGLMMPKLTGMACEAIGGFGLQHLANSLDSPNCRKIAKSLEELDAREPSAKEFVQQEQEFKREVTSLSQRAMLAVVFAKQDKEWLSRFNSRVQKNQTGRRRMMVAFAARAYELEKGKPPAVIADLVPDYLKAIPKDPVTGSNLTLSATSP
jgi:hypothetical protein